MNDHVAAEMEIMERRIVTIPSEDWDKFDAWVKSPPKDNPTLRRLAGSRST